MNDNFKSVLMLVTYSLYLVTEMNNASSIPAL